MVAEIVGEVRYDRYTCRVSAGILWVHSPDDLRLYDRAIADFLHAIDRRSRPRFPGRVGGRARGR